MSLFRMEVTLNIKPISINQAFQGRRFKTPVYKSFEKEMLLKMPSLILPKSPFKLTITYGFSNILCDLDNPTKLVTDIMQKKYMFNDRDIYEMVLYKKIVKKGMEYITYKLESI
jgi:Holliday junction resolvase RusA-like endonuclease